MQFLGHCVETIHDRVTGSRSLHRIGLAISWPIHSIAGIAAGFPRTRGDLGLSSLFALSWPRLCLAATGRRIPCIPETVIMAILASGRGEVGQELLHFNQVDFDLFLQTDEVDSEPRRLLLPVPL